MASAQAPAELLQRRVSELSTCPICIGEVQNAKVLPCLHTFCLQCLKDLWKDKSGQQRVTCPVCRQAFKLPAAGPDALPSNFFLQSLLEVGRDESGDASSCDAHPDRRLDRYCLRFGCQISRILREMTYFSPRLPPPGRKPPGRQNLPYLTIS